MSVFKDFFNDEFSDGILDYIEDFGCEIHIVYIMPDHSKKVHRISLSENRVYEGENIEIVSKEEVDQQNKWLDDLINE